MIEIPDHRSTNRKDYENYHRRGRMKQSWHLGVEAQRKDEEAVVFEDGFTWGSIGQILGYLLGEVDEQRQDELYDLMLKEYEQTNRGRTLRQ